MSQILTLKNWHKPEALSLLKLQKYWQNPETSLDLSAILKFFALFYYLSKKKKE